MVILMNLTNLVIFIQYLTQLLQADFNYKIIKFKTKKVLLMASNSPINFNTPQKSGFNNKSAIISPSRKSFNSFLNNRYTINSGIKNTSSTQSAVHSSLLEKIIENKIFTQEEYQNLLIYNKELELKILNLQEKAQTLRKKYKKVNKPLQQIKQKIQSSRLSVIQKKKYLQKFYVHLDSKLKSNMQSNLFNRLEKIQTALQQKYEQQRQELYQTLSAQHQKIQKQNEELDKLKEYRDELIKQYTQKAFQISSHRGRSEKGSPQSGKNQPSNKKNESRNSNNRKQSSSKNSQHQKASLKSQALKNRQNQIRSKQQQNRQRKQAKLNQKQQANKEVEFLKQNIKKLTKQKQNVEKQEKVLKMILNIDQQHKKYSSYIINGFKKWFTIKYREALHKRKSIPDKSNQKLRSSSTFSSSLGPLPDVEKLQKQLTSKTAQRKTLQQEVQIRNKGFEKCQVIYQQYLQEYSKLQSQLMDINNSSSSKNQSNRMTYNQNSFNNSYGADEYNPRSTYNPMSKRKY